MRKAVGIGAGSLGTVGAWLGAGMGIAFGGYAFNGMWFLALVFGVIGGMAGALWAKRKP